MPTSIDHVTLRAADLDGARAFYELVLGLRAGPRPPFAVPGVWLYAGARPVLHLLESSTRAPAGTIDHVAFAARGRAAIERRLARAGADYRLQAAPDGSALQLFVRDADGAALELVFRSKEDR